MNIQSSIAQHANVLGAAVGSTPGETLNYILEAYHRYYDTAFWLRDSKLLAERQRLLGQLGATAQEVLLEAVLPYPSATSISDVCARAGLSSETATLLAKILFSDTPEFRLREHQADALKIAAARDFAEKRNV